MGHLCALKPFCSYIKKTRLHIAACNQCNKLQPSYLKRAVNQSLIQIYNHTDLSRVF